MKQEILSFTNWNVVSYQSNAYYDARNEIMHNAEVLKSNICDYKNAYILVRGDIITTVHNIAT